MKGNLFWLDVRGRTQYVTLKHKASGSVVGCNFGEARKDTVGARNRELVPLRKGKADAMTSRGRWANIPNAREYIVQVLKRMA